ncbi:MAG: hypothetical protein AAFR21_13630 [Pseudomonadota bacterium]
MKQPRLSPIGFLFTVTFCVAMLFSISILVPHNKHDRFERHHDGTTQKADWIYARLTFNPTPVDVALIGTSRTGAGLSAPRIEAAYCMATGQRIHIANLSIPQTGRNLHAVIVKELLQHKSPGLILVEMNEHEARKPHPGFIFLADAEDILRAPVLINLNFASDLLRLPGRQLDLFMSGLLPNGSRVDSAQDHLSSDHLDRTDRLVLRDGSIVSRDVIVDRPYLTREKTRRTQSAKATHVLPEFLYPLEYRFSRIYLERIEEAAANAGAQIDYAYLPAWEEPTFPPTLAAELGGRKPSFVPTPDIANDPDLWLDPTHLNAAGARALTAEFAEWLVQTAPNLGRPAAPGPCPSVD